jgi:hypothetical protein
MISVTATAAARPALGTASTFPSLIDVMEIVGRYRVTAETHDRIREVVAFERAHPRLDLETRAPTGSDGADEDDQPGQVKLNACPYTHINSQKK